MRPTTTIEVAATSTSAISTRLFAGWGSLKHGPVSMPGEALLCACAGSDQSGNEVIALLDAPAVQGATVEALSEYCWKRSATLAGRPWTHGAAVQLPLLALTVASALHTVGLPTGQSSVGLNSKVPANLLITGSSGRLPGLLVQLATARGVRTCVAAQSGACQQLLSLGAAEVIDHNVVSFSAAFGSRKGQILDAVLDCVGVEGTPEAIRTALGASYVSLASPSLQRLQEDGALAVAQVRWRQWRKSGGNEHESATIWRPDANAARALSEVLELVEEGRVVPPPEANAALETLEQFGEFVSWARDTESGRRYGFPGESIWPAAYGGDGDVAARKPKKLWTTLGGYADNLAFIEVPDGDEYR